VSTYYWRATVTITAHNSSHQALSNVKVSASWSGSYTGSASCTTNTSGQCSLNSGYISKRSTSVTFTVTSLTYPSSGGTVISGSSLTSDTGSSSVKVTYP
jgi:hypothetical protein